MVASARLRAEPRKAQGKGAARRLRAAGRIPAVLYGHNEPTRLISLEHHEVEKLFSRISVENTILDLQIKGGRREVRALVREVQLHPFRRQIRHVDFYLIHADEPVDVVVPIRLDGTPAGVLAGGILQQVLHDLPIRCLPHQIPDVIEADVSSLAIGDSLHASALPVPEGVVVGVEPDRTVCSVQPPAVEAIEPSVPEATEGVGGEVEPELIRKRPQEAEEPPATEAG